MRKGLASLLYGTIILANIGIFALNRQLDYTSVRNEVAARADINHDGMTSREEWKNVYSIVGYHYDELNPRRLTAQDLKKFLRFTAYSY